MSIGRQGEDGGIKVAGGEIGGRNEGNKRKGKKFR